MQSEVPNKLIPFADLGFKGRVQNTGQAHKKCY